MSALCQVKLQGQKIHGTLMYSFKLMLKKPEVKTHTYHSHESSGTMKRAQNIVAYLPPPPHKDTPQKNKSKVE